MKRKRTQEDGYTLQISAGIGDTSWCAMFSADDTQAAIAEATRMLNGCRIAAGALTAVLWPMLPGDKPLATVKPVKQWRIDRATVLTEQPIY